jgi:hypothetical protein
MIEVFKTNVYEEDKSKIIIQKLHEYFPENKVNFDLDDYDKILKVEGDHISSKKIMTILNDEGHFL